VTERRHPVSLANPVSLLMDVWLAGWLEGWRPFAAGQWSNPFSAGDGLDA